MPCRPLLLSFSVDEDKPQQEKEGVMRCDRAHFLKRAAWNFKLFIVFLEARDISGKDKQRKNVTDKPQKSHAAFYRWSSSEAVPHFKEIQGQWTDIKQH